MIESVSQLVRSSIRATSLRASCSKAMNVSRLKCESSRYKKQTFQDVGPIFDEKIDTTIFLDKS